jgi:predicted PolB exonuclease-like 3'-5' exonuclease
MTPILAFDIETVPDVTGYRQLWELPQEMTDAEVAELAFYKQRQAGGSDFLPLYMHRVVTISCALKAGSDFRVWSLAEPDDGEPDILRRFFEGIEKYTPQLVSWNGGGFDLPVLHHRAMVRGVTASRYWEWGDEDRDFRYNNYVNRYHTRHLDLMDVLAAYQARANAPLDAMAQLCGFPGKLGMAGDQVWPAHLEGRHAAIRDYCETDAVNTFLLFLRFQLMRGVLTQGQYMQECTLVRSALEAQNKPHWREFLAAWK